MRIKRFNQVLNCLVNGTSYSENIGKLLKENPATITRVLLKMKKYKLIRSKKIPYKNITEYKPTRRGIEYLAISSIIIDYNIKLEYYHEKLKKILSPNYRVRIDRFNFLEHQKNRRLKNAPR